MFTVCYFFRKIYSVCRRGLRKMNRPFFCRSSMRIKKRLMESAIAGAEYNRATDSLWREAAACSARSESIETRSYDRYRDTIVTRYTVHRSFYHHYKVNTVSYTPSPTLVRPIIIKIKKKKKTRTMNIARENWRDTMRFNGER